MNIPPPVVTLDGPGGSGKGTIARHVATALGWHCLDSGALYRALALAAAERGIDAQDDPALRQLARDFELRFDPDPSIERIFLDGREVSGRLREETVGECASRLAARPVVREALLARQHAFRRDPGLVADGRDMGTVVFPDAVIKIFLTASPEERAARRHKQLMDKGIDASLAALAADIAQRDRRDASRPVSPLRPAADAVVLDTTGLAIPEVVARVLALARERLGT